MFKNFIILAYRHFVRSPLTSFIELFGLTAAFTVALLVLLWVTKELSKDKFNEKADRIYRLESVDSNLETSAIHSSSIAPLIKEYLPEVEEVVRIGRIWNSNDFYVLKDGKKEFLGDRRVLTMDSTYHKVFSFEFLAGDPKTALNDKNSIVVFRSLAETYFGKTDVVGEKIYFGNRNRTISGVIEDVEDFHMPFSMLGYFMPGGGGYSKGKEILKKWRYPSRPTYLLLKENQDVAQLEKKIHALIEEHRPDHFKELRPFVKFNLRNISDIYFNSDGIAENGYVVHGDFKQVVAYATIAILTLVLACINFINLNTAKSFERTKEVGMKRISGASRKNIFVQFIGETLILCFVSFVLALIFTHTILPFFSDLTGSSLTIGKLFDPALFVFVFLGIMVVSIVSGGFPASYISSFAPVRAVKGINHNGKSGGNVKQVSLAIQFSLITILLIGLVTVVHQINYMKNASLGFEKEQRVFFRFPNNKNAGPLKTRLLSHPSIQNVSHNNAIPGKNNIVSSRPFRFIHKENEYNLSISYVDEDYQKTLDLELVAGRFFDSSHPQDHEIRGNEAKVKHRVVNETTVKTMGLEDPVGTYIHREGIRFKIIGVIRDFHLNGLNNPIKPMFFLWVDLKSFMLAKISPGDLPSTLNFISEEVQAVTGRQPDIKFLDQNFNRQYESDNKFANLLGYFTILAFVIAAMGLIGVSAHNIKIRIKEIGIRKTMGASSLQILKLIIRPFSKIILISTIISVPIGAAVMDSWLNNYAYRIDLTWWIFGIACALTVLISLSTIIWQSWRASSVNPARLIRYE